MTAHTIYIMIWLDTVKRILVLNVKVLSWSLAVVVAAQVGTWASGETTGFFAKGAALRVEGKPQEALEAFQQELVATPGQAETLVQMGATLEDLGKLQAAADCYRQALRRDPGHAAARRNLEQLEALRALNEAPKSPHPAREELLQRGLQAMENHDLDRAQDLFRLSRGILDQDPRPLFFTAIAAERRGLTRKAIDLYEQTVTAFPGFAPGWTNLVIALLLSGNRQDAVTRVLEARKAVPDDRGIRWLLDLTAARAR